MEIHVKLLGSLSQQFPTKVHRTWLTIDLAKDATVNDLLSYLNIDSPGDTVVISCGRIMRIQDRLSENRRISIFPVVHGG